MHSKLISICVQAKPHNVFILHMYILTFMHEHNELEEFYLQLDKVVKAVPKKDIFTVFGDWNTKVSPDAWQERAGTMGEIGLVKTNDKDLRLLEFVQSQRLTLANTLHTHSRNKALTREIGP